MEETTLDAKKAKNQQSLLYLNAHVRATFLYLVMTSLWTSLRTHQDHGYTHVNILPSCTSYWYLL